MFLRYPATYDDGWFLQMGYTNESEISRDAIIVYQEKVGRNGTPVTKVLRTGFPGNHLGVPRQSSTETTRMTPPPVTVFWPSIASRGENKRLLPPAYVENNMVHFKEEFIPDSEVYSLFFCP